MHLTSNAKFSKKEIIITGLKGYNEGHYLCSAYTMNTDPAIKGTLQTSHCFVLSISHSHNDYRVWDPTVQESKPGLRQHTRSETVIQSYLKEYEHVIFWKLYDEESYKERNTSAAILDHNRSNTENYGPRIIRALNHSIYGGGARNQYK